MFHVEQFGTKIAYGSAGLTYPRIFFEVSCTEVVFLQWFGGLVGRQNILNKGLTSKILQTNGLWEGLEAEVGVFARTCVDLLLCFRLSCVHPELWLAPGPVRLGHA